MYSRLATLRVLSIENFTNPDQSRAFVEIDKFWVHGVFGDRPKALELLQHPAR